MIPTLLATLLASTPAHAGADLAVTVTVPTQLAVYAEGRHEVTVANVGNRHARDAQVDIQLPETATSPTVHVLGDLGAIDGDCSQVGTTLTCDLGSIRKGRSETVWFDIALPVSSEPLEFEATASARRDSNPANDTDNDVTDLVYDAVAVSGPVLADNQHCTGQGLTAYYECTLYPSSISGHQVRLYADGTLDFPGQPVSYGGTWSQPTPDSLEMTYTDGGAVVANFSGNGVPGDCFEGLTVFPGSPWVAPYEVCLQ